MLDLSRICNKVCGMKNIFTYTLIWQFIFPTIKIILKLYPKHGSYTWKIWVLTSPEKELVFMKPDTWKSLE